jgi:hypothetical protein
MVKVKMEDEIITWEEWEKKESKAIIDSISIAIGELERRGITESERDGLITIGVLIEKLCLKRTVEQKG